MLGDRRVHAAVACSGTGPTVWFVRRPASCSCSSRWAPGRRRGPRSAASAMVLVIGASSAVANASERHLVAVLPDLRLRCRTSSVRRPTRPTAGRRTTCRSTASRTSRCWDSTQAAAERPPRAGYAWFPDRTYDRVLIIGAGSRDRHGARARQGRQARRRGRDRPGARPDRPRLPPGGRLQGPAGDASTSTTAARSSTAPTRSTT